MMAIMLTWIQNITYILVVALQSSSAFKDSTLVDKLIIDCKILGVLALLWLLVDNSGLGRTEGVTMRDTSIESVGACGLSG